MYPTKLNNIINLFETLPEDERRETLVSYADNAKKQEPREDEKFELVDVRKDEDCTDTVGVYLHVDENGKAHIRMTLGPEVQTLTRSMTAILCKGLEGSTPQEILDLPSDFVTRIVGAELVRIRSQTIYYVLTRIKSICKVYLDRQRMAASGVAPLVIPSRADGEEPPNRCLVTQFPAREFPSLCEVLRFAQDDNTVCSRVLA